MTIHTGLVTGNSTGTGTAPGRPAADRSMRRDHEPSVPQQGRGMTGAMTGAVPQQRRGMTGVVPQQRRGVAGAVPRQGRGVTGSVSPRGRGLAASSTVLIGLGMAFGYPELVVLGMAGIVAVLAALAYVARLPALAVTRVADPARVACGEACTMTMLVRNTGRWRSTGVTATDACTGRPVTVPLPGLAPGAGIEGSYHLPTSRRGVLTSGPLWIRRRDPCDLARSARGYGQQQHIRVYPRVHPLGDTPAGATRSLDGRLDRVPHGSITFDSLREYVVGDELRRVHWRTTARMGALMVREDMDTSLPRLVVLLDNRDVAYQDHRAVCGRAAGMAAGTSTAMAAGTSTAMAAGKATATSANTTTAKATDTSAGTATATSGGTATATSGGTTTATSAGTATATSGGTTTATAAHTTADTSADTGTDGDADTSTLSIPGFEAACEAAASIVMAASRAELPVRLVLAADDPSDDPDAPERTLPGAMLDRLAEAALLAAPDALDVAIRALQQHPAGDTLIVLTGSDEPADLAAVSVARTTYPVCLVTVFTGTPRAGGAIAGASGPLLYVSDGAAFAAAWDGILAMSP